MSESVNPFTTMFEMQRTSIEQARAAVHSRVAFQKRMAEMWADSMATGQSIQRRNAALARNTTDAYLDAMGATVPGAREATESLTESVDESFDALDEASEQAWKSAESGAAENADAYSEFADRYVAMYDDAVDAYLDTLAEFEGMTAEAVDVEFDEE